MEAGNQIDLHNLILLVVVVVCSYGLALILTVTCWNSYTRHRTSDVYCTACLSPPAVNGYAPGMPPPGYSLGPGVPCQFESHTADQRLGLMGEGAGAEASQVPFSAQLLSSAQPSLVAGAGGDAAGFLQPDDGLLGLLQSEEGLDRDTTLSRSFRSSLFQSQSSPLQMFQMEEVKKAKDENTKLTLHERFSVIKGTENNNEENRQSKMNQVRVLTSPPASDNILMSSSASRTPSTAREKVVKQRTSRRSLKSVFGRNKIKSASNSKDTFDTARDPATTDTHLDTTDNEEVFLSKNKNSVVKDVDSDQPPVKPRRTSDWTDPKKGRKVGSPGRTGNADFFIRQAPLRSVDIDLGPGRQGDAQMSEYVKRTRTVTSRAVSSAPQAPAQSRASHGGAKPKDRSQFLRPPSLRKRSRTRPYNPASESEITDFSADEERRQGGARVARLLELPPRLSPGSSEAGDISVTPPPPASTDVSPEVSPLGLGQYSSVSFTQSDMDLICSPNRTEPVKTTTDEAESLQWDDYDHQSELSFRKTCEANSNSENQ